ncbi:hypothetical protein DTO027B5_3682 [Paecilomyces variotii]|nr:hypothetical protein DTO169C6_7142 [Paecilomyces variotii]KAJ9326103.1 hypothetical protein DTO027B3_3079 [Paecilomyces variotii]KAJ9334445.1 hypothetical protein DTO027B5_3682 [Paecilomyces variotii]
MSSPADSKTSKTVASAFESPTFGEDSSFHVEQPVGSASISPCGRDVVLASKEGLHIIDLDSPYSPPRYLPHHTPWEVADVQWSPFAVRDYWVVSTSNQKALVWNLAMKSHENSIEHVLHAHSRAITDINFSAHHPDTLATCGVDSFVHCWDLRTPARPVVSFSDWFAGATQVKWNRQDPHVIASSHDKFLRIWDKRMGATPIKSIEAHSTTIYGVDWNRVRPGAVTTCSLDKTIKFWDYTAEGEVPEKVIKTPFPVWRARNTPFGWGVLAMPQRGNSDLHLYSRRTPEGNQIFDPNQTLSLVHSFPGHKGQVKEFLWRARGSVMDGIDHRDFQLVSWGTDRELRLHRVDPEVLRAVGYEKGKSFVPTLNITRKGAVYKTYRDEPLDQDFTELFESEPALSSGPRTTGQHRPRTGGGIAMNNVSLRSARPWTQGGQLDSRVGMQTRSNIRADTNPIAWMRGVKISGWDIETLGDEITHVGERFTKVVFESVDIRQRKTTVSLHGPWGPEGASLFLKVDIKFPSEYPRSAIPTFNIQRTTSVTDQLANKIASELRTIAETYLAKKRGCLEGVLRYLLGECNLEESVAWVLGETAETVKSPVTGTVEGEESSDEDEEVGQFQNQDLGMSSELLRPVNANVMVPVAKACGALWANDGRLVCFFPPKKDRQSAVFDTLGFSAMTRLSRADKVFEGFGRLQTSSPGPRTTTGTGTGTGTGTNTITDDGTSDYSDDSSVASSSSSGSSGLLTGLPSRFPAPQTWRSAGSLGFRQARSTDNSQKSTNGGGPQRSSDAPQNIISIHDFNYLLPAKRELAVQYRIFGKGADVCAHNAAVAADAGYHDLAQVWGLIRLILHNQVPNEPELQADIPTIARLATTGDMKRKDSGVDLSYDNPKASPDVATSSNIRWGEHPLGGRWLVPALFDHFERIGDVQMLAMLSSIFHESGTRRNASPRLHRRDNTTSAHIEDPSFSLDFNYSKPTSHRSQVTTPITIASRDSHNTSGVQSPRRSSAEFLRSDFTPPYSTGTTPPVASRAGAVTADRKSNIQGLSISASPDQHSVPRSSSGIGSALASSLSRSFTFGPSSASPPASTLKQKRPSPNGSLNTSAGPGAWTTSGFFSRAASAIPDYLTTSGTMTSQAQSDTESERRPQLTKQPMRMKITFKNQDSFDSDGNSHNTFLDNRKDWLYGSYRAAYAHLLFIWGLPIQRSEVLKINRITDSATPRFSRHGSHSPRASISLPSSKRKESPAPLLTEANRGLDIQKHCTNCGFALQLSVFATSSKKNAANGKTATNQSALKCPNCKPVQPLPTRLPCIICGEIVDGMFTPCLNCGHLSCFECHQLWFSRPPDELTGTSTQNIEQKDSTGVQFCPSGCGCNCSEHVVYKVSLPPSLTPGHEGDSRHSSRSRSRRRWTEISPGSSSRVSLNAGHDQDDLEIFRSSPFASLARGLGAGLSRGLTSKDEKKESSAPNATKEKKSSHRPTRTMR